MEKDFTEQQLRTVNQLVLIELKNNKGISHQDSLRPILKKTYTLEEDQDKQISDNKDHQEVDDSSETMKGKESGSTIGSSMAIISDQAQNESLLYYGDNYNNITESYISKLLGGS